MANYNMEALRRKKQELDDRAALVGGPFFTPAEGRSLLRVLPQWEPNLGVFYYEFYSHWIQIAQRGSLCANVHFTPEIQQAAATAGRGMCYFCEIQGQHKGLKARARYLLNMVDLQKPEDGVQIWNIGPQLLGDMLTFFFDPEWGDFTDPERGFDCILTRQGTGRDTDYTFMLRRNSTPLLNMTWLQKMNNLSSILTVDSYEEQVALMAGKMGPAVPAQPFQARPFVPMQQAQPFTPMQQTQQFAPMQQAQQFAPMQQAQQFTPMQQAQQFTPMQQAQQFAPYPSGGGTVPTQRSVAGGTPTTIVTPLAAIALPPCFQNYGNPQQGYSCMTCPDAFDCESNSSIGFGQSVNRGAGYSQPLAQQPLAQQPLAQQPLAQQPLAQQPLAQQPLAQQPAVPPPVAMSQPQQQAQQQPFISPRVPPPPVGI